MQGNNNVGSIALTIDTRKVDQESTASINSVILREHISYSLPSIEILVRQHSKLLDNYPVYEGSKIEITLTSIADGYTYSGKFCCFSVDEQKSGAGDNLLISCYADYPDIFLHAKYAAYTGSSYDVFNQIAQENNMQFDGDPSNDTQVWIRAGENGYKFMRHVCEHSYADPQSMFSFSVNRNETLRFYNLDKRNDLPAKWRLIEIDDMYNAGPDTPKLKDDEIFVQGVKYGLLSGLLNKHSGYGSIANSKSFLSTSTDLKVNELKKRNQFKDVNKDLDKPTRVLSIPFDCGNTHANYHQATIQNRTLLSHYARQASLQTVRCKDVQLLDTVTIVGMKEFKLTARETQNVDYFVESHMLYFSPVKGFVQQLGIITDGFNSLEPISQVY